MIVTSDESQWPLIVSPRPPAVKENLPIYIKDTTDAQKVRGGSRFQGGKPHRGVLWAYAKQPAQQVSNEKGQTGVF